jgi:hypothetical protein
MKEIFASILFLAAVAGTLWGWNDWRVKQKDKQDTRPSIGTFSSVPVAEFSDQNPIPQEKRREPSSDAATQERTEIEIHDSIATTTVASDTSKDALEVKVMNGGAAKGTAGSVQELLKRSGYAKASASSATGDYAGVTVYYTGAHEAQATDIQRILLAKYPKAAVTSAVSGRVEESSATIVVMMGK